jgi:hypothetical protein
LVPEIKNVCQNFVLGLPNQRPLSRKATVPCGSSLCENALIA